MKRTVVTVVLLSALAAAGCEQPPAPQQPAPPAQQPPPVAPSPAPTPSAPPASGATAVAQELYTTNCAICHGPTGTGASHFKQMGIPDFTDSAWHARESDAQLAAVIRKGKGRFMPAWEGKLTADEIQALVRFLRTLPDRTGSATSEG
jgi:mono/diheme cytochrome c family protein